MAGVPPDWRSEGVRVIKSDRLDTNTAQTPGMLRAAAIDFRRVGSKKLWAGTVLIHPNAKTGAHHHGALESVTYVPHQEINALKDTPLECVLVRSDNESVVVNLSIEAAERVEEVYWIDPVHPTVTR
jgi:uncharacterized RmlC-like cupin family protein